MTLVFLPASMRFNPDTRAVHLVADCKGSKTGVLLSRAAIEYLAGAENLDRDRSMIVVRLHKDILQYAAAMALAPYGDNCRATVVELSDLIFVLPGGVGARLAGKAGANLIPRNS